MGLIAGVTALHRRSNSVLRAVRQGGAYRAVYQSKARSVFERYTGLDMGAIGVDSMAHHVLEPGNSFYRLSV